MGIGESYQKIRSELPQHVTIVLACKTRTPEEIDEVIQAGATDLGENYVQEAELARETLGEKAKRVRWHLIGPLQTNKINKALQLFDVIQTVGSVKKAKAIDKRAARVHRVMPVYIEVNIGQESAKAGAAPQTDALETLARSISKLDHLRLKGLMTMGPIWNDAEGNRPYFAKTRELFERIRDLDLPRVSMETLSMGMSDSYRVAIEEGSNMVRLGTIIFGPRE